MTMSTTPSNLAALACVGTLLAALAMPLQAQQAQPTTDSSLFQDFGGLDVLRKVVDDTLALALADVRIKDTFKDVDMKRLARLITEQFCELTGGPCKYSGDPMKEVHQGLGLSNRQFNALVEDLQQAMDQSRVPSRTQNRLLALLAPMQRSIVSK